MENQDKLRAERDFNLVLRQTNLPEKQYHFFKNLVNPQSETCGDIVKSYVKAGYKENDTCKYYAYKIYNSTKFQAVLSAYREKELKMQVNREFTMLERTTQDLNFVIEQSRKGGDLSTMRQAVMDRAKLHGLMIERHQVIDPVTEGMIDKQTRIEAARIAEQRLLQEPEGAPEIETESVIDAEFVNECTTDSSNNEIESALLSA